MGSATCLYVGLSVPVSRWSGGWGNSRSLHASAPYQSMDLYIPASFLYLELEGEMYSEPWQGIKRSDHQFELLTLEFFCHISKYPNITKVTPQNVPLMTYFPSTASTNVASRPSTAMVFNIRSLRSNLRFRLIRKIWAEKRRRESEEWSRAR